MLTNNRIYLGAVLLILGFMFVFVVSQVVYSFSPESKISHCDGMENWDLQIDCVYLELGYALEEHGLGFALQVLDAASELNLPPFSEDFCHRHTHNLGDRLYYEVYLIDNGFDAIEFPQISTMCSYGIFHAMLEHLIQDNPSVRFADDTCTYLRKKLGNFLGDIGIACYIGVGHGFILHNLENINEDSWGDIKTFINEPVSQCEKLNKARPNEIEACINATFESVVNWARDKEFGFDFDKKSPLRNYIMCHEFESKYQVYCYRSITREIVATAGINDPVKLIQIVENSPKPSLGIDSFRYGIRTMSVINGFNKILKLCDELSDELFRVCVTASIEGLMLNGPSQEEYKEPLLICEDNYVRKRSLRIDCYSHFSKYLKKFYSKSKIKTICKEFPKDVRHFCNEYIN